LIAVRLISLALFVSLAAPPTLHAHIHLLRSVPAADSLAGGPVREIRLVFSEQPELGFSRIRLIAADGTEIPLGAVVTAPAEQFGVVASLQRRLVSGTYTVRWQTAGRDGHVIRGEFTFTAPDDATPDSASSASSDTLATPAPESEGVGFPVGLVAVGVLVGVAAIVLVRSRR
jgi:methionine-rich copper-binding protein CopC